jgi:hypothetical protein
MFMVDQPAEERLGIEAWPAHPVDRSRLGRQGRSLGVVQQTILTERRRLPRLFRDTTPAHALFHRDRTDVAVIESSPRVGPLCVSSRKGLDHGQVGCQVR